jgi:energy-coupling factor transporter ATP-binding protein EcfA2
MPYPSFAQVSTAAKNLSTKEGDNLVRTNGLWHVLMFLRHCALRGNSRTQTFNAYDLSEAAYDLTGLYLPIDQESRNCYFEPGATQGNSILLFFRHHQGPRQTFLNRIYTGLAGAGPRQPNIFSVSNTALPTEIRLNDNWIQTLRDLSDNESVLDTKTFDLITWIFRYGIPFVGSSQAHITEHTGNGCLKIRENLSLNPLPTSADELVSTLRSFFGLSEDEITELFPHLNSVDFNIWTDNEPISPNLLDNRFKNFLTGQTVEASNLANLTNQFVRNVREEANLKISKKNATRLAASLLAKKFLILTGLSGSGKTKLAQTFSRWITHDSLASIVVPVGADWTSRDQILGYHDGIKPERYVKQAALELILAAQKTENIDKLFFLILDEMNLSHVERYFADFLSAIESEEGIPMHGEGDSDDHMVDGVRKRLELPENMFVIGTVNVDETTYMFSPKVLDRANVMEFRIEPSEFEDFLSNPKKVNLSAIACNGAHFAEDFIIAAKQDISITHLQEGLMQKIADAEIPQYDVLKRELVALFRIFQDQSWNFGYRIGKEISRFVFFHKLLSGDDWKFADALDAQIIQKMMPKLNGSESRLNGILKALAWYCSGREGELHEGNTVEGKTPQERASAILKKIDDSTADDPEKIFKDLPLDENGNKGRFPLSMEKTVRMWKAVKANGFTSFAEN